jgi:hypothetical protein
MIVTTRQRRSLVAAMALVALMSDPSTGPVLTAQQAPASAPPTFRTEANYVRVDVDPTRDGAPKQYSNCFSTGSSGTS